MHHQTTCCDRPPRHSTMLKNVRYMLPTKPYTTPLWSATVTPTSLGERTKMKIRFKRRHNYITANACSYTCVSLYSFASLIPRPLDRQTARVRGYTFTSSHTTHSTPLAHSRHTHLIAAAFERRHSIQGDQTLLKTDTMAYQESTPNKKGSFDEHSSLEDLIRKLATECNIYFQADILNHMNNIW